MLIREVINRSFWALPKGEVLDILETSASGLTEEEVSERQTIFKKNVLPQRQRLSKFAVLLRQFESPLLILLLVAVVITALLGDFKDASFIAIAALANVLLGFYQENKAEAALAHLKTYVRERTRVFRDGQEQEIDVNELVPGDIVHVAQGDRVPADCRLIYVNDLMVDESILTGESLPILKNTEPASFKAVIADQHSMVFSGTFVAQGFANAAVCRTGQQTELGKIASYVASAEREKTPLQKAILRFSLKASIILVAMTAALFFVGLGIGKSPLEMFLISVAIAVAAVPEGLPVAMTVILAIGVQRLAKKNGVVRKLLAAETLGSTSVILTDKTGTLTQAKMTLSKITSFSKKLPNHHELILKLAILSSDVVIENPKDSPDKWRIIGRPLEAAIVKSAAEQGVLLPKVRKEIKVLEYLPFSSASKFSATILELNNRRLLSIFGAPEILLRHSSFNEEERRNVHKAIDEMAHSGERVLGIATKELKSVEEAMLKQKKVFSELDFLGTVSFRDPVRPGVAEAIGRIAQSGVKTAIVTGDHLGTAISVAKEIGLSVDKDQVINGEDLDGLSDAELKQRLPNITVVSRVSPDGKVRIAKTFKELGETVAMTGDGLNDAASLKEADIGVAMGSGSDVAKDVSDLVLLDDDFSTIVAAVEEGRRILENIRKVIIYLSSSVFGELILISASLLTGLALPINALQILFINFITDSFPAIGLAFEDHADYLLERRRRIATNLFDKEMLFLMLAIGVPTAALFFALYWSLLSYGLDPVLVRTFIFAAFGTYTLVTIFAVRSLRRPVFTINPFSNPQLLVTVVFGIGSVAASLYWPFLQNLFGIVPLPPIWLAGVAAVGVTSMLAIELGKLVIRRFKMNGN